MVSNVVNSSSKANQLVWIVALALIASGLSANYYFSDYSLLVRTVGLLVVLAAAVFLAFKTTQGQQFKVLWQEAVIEVRKVVWPTKKETMQSVFAVLAMVTVMGLLLWMVDAMLLRIVAWLTGHSGV